MLAVFVNAVVVLLGGVLGTAFGRFLNEKLTKAAMAGIALCVVYIGISGAMKGQNILITIAAMATGAILGTLADIDGAVTHLGDKAQELTRDRFGKVAEGFVKMHETLWRNTPELAACAIVEQARLGA